MHAYLEGIENLPEGAGGVQLAVVAALDDSLEELAAGDQVQNQLDFSARLEHLAQPDLTHPHQKSLASIKSTTFHPHFVHGN